MSALLLAIDVGNPTLRLVIAVLMAWLILGEHITWRIVFGCSLIIAGLFVVSRR